MVNYKYHTLEERTTVVMQSDNSNFILIPKHKLFCALEHFRTQCYFLIEIRTSASSHAMREHKIKPEEMTDEFKEKIRRLITTAM